MDEGRAQDGRGIEDTEYGVMKPRSRGIEILVEFLSATTMSFNAEETPAALSFFSSSLMGRAEFRVRYGFSG